MVVAGIVSVLIANILNLRLAILIRTMSAKLVRQTHGLVVALRMRPLPKSVFLKSLDSRTGRLVQYLAYAGNYDSMHEEGES